MSTPCQELIDQAAKALALSEWDEAVDKYADALEIMRGIHGDLAPELAVLLLPYGKALLEVASRSQGVLGKEEDGPEPNKEETSGGANFHFEGDAESDNDEGEAEGEGKKEGDEAGDAEDVEDDDFTVAWEVLDLARTLFEKQASEGKDVGRQLGECFGLLGDVSLENENFPQAVEDYKSALTAYSVCLPTSARQIAASHYKLAIVLENIADRREEAVENVTKAIESVGERKSVIERGIDPDTTSQPSGKGKGKAGEHGAPADWSDAEKQAKVKDLQEQLDDLDAKLQDLKSAPQQQDVVEQSIAHLLGNAPTDIDIGKTVTAAASSATAKVNDLTGMVKRKGKKNVEAAGAVLQNKTGEVQNAVSEQATSVQNAVASQVNNAQKIVSEQASNVQDAVMSQVGNAQKIFAQQASSVQDAVTAQVSDAQEAVVTQVSSVQEAVTSAVTTQFNNAQEAATTQAEALQKNLSELADQAGSSIQQRVEDMAHQASSTVDSLLSLGSAQAQNAASSIRKAAIGVYQDIMEEGQAFTRNNVEAVEGVAQDIVHGKEQASHAVDEITGTGVSIAQEAYAQAVRAGKAVLDEVIEEGKEATQEVVEAVAGTAEDVLGGIEAVGREGKRKVEEVMPEVAAEDNVDVPVAKKQKRGGTTS